MMQRLQTVLRHVSSRACLSSTSANVAPSIVAEPRIALYDEDVRITLHNFPPQEKVTLLGQFVQLSSKIEFASCGHYVSSSAGQIDLSTDASKGGTYSGVEPMGFLWSLRSAPGHPQDTRMTINVTDRPIVVTLKAFIGHLHLDDIYINREEEQVGPRLLPLAQTHLERFCKAEGVTRHDVQDGNIRGALYLPPGEGPFQGVIDMFGSSGGLTEYRSALLASRGFAALSLAYFKYRDLQDHLYDLRYEYFEEAVQWLTSHQKVVSSGIGVIAVSKGTENALLMGAYSPKVRAVVAINGYCFATVGNFLRNNQVILTGQEIDVEKICFTDDGLDLRDVMSEPTDIIPVWRGPAKYLFLVSLDDYQTRQNAYKDLLAECPELKKGDIKVVEYEGAGHLLEPPYNPLCRSSVNKGIGVKMKWGGQPREHAYAQIDAWKRTLSFFHSYIPTS